MGVPPRDNDLLKRVHPGRYMEIYREPVIAADIMKKYPRHCIARPDVFKFPWIVVRPESVLVPGKVFYLVPFRTMRKLLETKKQQHNQHSSRRNHRRHHHQNPPIKSMAGVTPKHLQNDRYYSGQFDNMNSRKNLHQDRADYEIDSLFDSVMTRIPRLRETSREHDDLRLISCMRKPDSGRKLLKLKVTFISPIIIPSTPR